MRRDAPADAATTSAIPITSRALSDWPRRIRPASAATAGSRLIRTPNTEAAIRRSASCSNEYGIAEERTPQAAAGDRAERLLQNGVRDRRGEPADARADRERPGLEQVRAAGGDPRRQ